MAKATITVSYPTTRNDGTALPTARIGGAHVLKQQPDSSFAVIGTITFPATSFDDPTDLAPGTYTYKASVFDTNPAVKEGDPSQPASVSVAAPEAPPGEPTITVTVA